MPIDVKEIRPKQSQQDTDLDKLEKASAGNEELSKKEQRIAYWTGIEDFLEEAYEWRRCDLKNELQYRSRRITRADDVKWKPVYDSLISSLVRRMRIERGMDVSLSKVKEIIMSDFTPKSNPVEEYFTALNWDRQPHIDRLARTVHTDAMKLWPMFLRRWLIATVANALTYNYRCQNHTCLVLVGDQGTYKSTFIHSLVPEELQDYYYSGKIDPTNKDGLAVITQNFICNIDDQLVQINKKAADDMKGLLNMGIVTYRKPYDSFFTKATQIASFIGSVNDNQFLTDPTGNRRYLPVTLTRPIDIEEVNRINMDQVWAEAYHAFRNGEHYYFTPEEQKKILEYVAQYEVDSLERDLLYYYYAPATEEEVNASMGSALTASVIKSKIEGRSGGKSRLSIRKLGMELKKGFVCKKIREDGKRQQVYFVKDLNP